MLKLNIKTIPHKKQRYPTCGDYWKDSKGIWQVRISELGNHNEEILIAVHEIMELFLTQNRGIMISEIDEFDFNFEKERLQGLHKVNDEPGMDPKAPYFKEHKFATKVERMFAKELGVNWRLYDKKVTMLK